MKTKGPIFIGGGSAVQKKVITTMVIRSLDDRAYCDQSAFTHLGLHAKAVWLFIASRYSPGANVSS